MSADKARTAAEGFVGLLAFLRARIDEDEASEAPHRPSCQMLKPVPDDWGGPLLGDTFSCNCDAADRWLRDIEAKRRILAEYHVAFDRARRLFRDDLASAGALLQMLAVVKLLALSYAGHPDYRQEWAPAR